MLQKKKLIESIQELPANFSSEDAIDRIIIFDKIQEGVQQSKEGKSFSIKQVETRLKKWLK